MKIIADENIPYVKEAFSSLGTVTTLAGRNMQASDVKDADILLVRSVTKVDQNLIGNSSIKFVASATIGFDHIDLDYLAKKKIGFARAPASNAISAAEYVLTAIAWWSKKRNINWSNLSVGIIGCGNVGSRVKQRCEAVGLKCVVNDPPLQQQGVKGLSTIEDALACDVVTLHVPLSKTGEHPTYQLLNNRNMDHIHKQSLLINAARGFTIDETILKQRTDIDLILDCWDGEPVIDQQLLAQTLLASAHIAGYSLDGKIRGTEMIYQACCDFFKQPAKWSSNNIKLDKPEKIEAKTDIRDVLLSAYPITEDSDRLKKLLTDNKNPAAYFDYLRKNYPIRREFSQWTVDAQKLDKQQTKILEALQFKIQS